MGIDAKMFVRNRGRRLSAEELRQLSAELREEFPDGPFWPLAEKQIVLSSVRTLGEHRSELARDRVAYPDAAKWFQEDEETLSYPNHLQIWEQDGLSLVSAPDEQLIEIHLIAWYFSSSYPRGPWQELRAIADWLEKQFANGEVWYGGDSSGVVAYHLTPALKDAYSRALEEVEWEDGQAGG